MKKSIYKIILLIFCLAFFNNCVNEPEDPSIMEYIVGTFTRTNASLDIISQIDEHDNIDKDNSTHFILKSDYTYSLNFKGYSKFMDSTIVINQNGTFEIGQTYYYKVSAFDFAGNLSDYSPSVSVFITTNVSVSNIVPEKFDLFQNFPNPFNPTTKIRFALPQQSNVKLAVYNLIGQKVAELINTEMEAGYHTIDFDASNFSSGLYFFRITAGKFIAVRKMMMLK